jgi:hypothetical protein
VINPEGKEMPETVKPAFAGKNTECIHSAFCCSHFKLDILTNKVVVPQGSVQTRFPLVTDVPEPLLNEAVTIGTELLQVDNKPVLTTFVTFSVCAPDPVAQHKLINNKKILICSLFGVKHLTVLES